MAGFANSEPVNVYHDEYSVRNYILFGDADPIGGIDLTGMTPEQGMVYEYLPGTTQWGQDLVPGLIELSGDINGDGFDDAVSVTGDYREADYGGRVDLRVLYGSDLRNNALFATGGDDDNEVVVRREGSVYTAGGSDTVLIRPNVGPQHFEIDAGAGRDVLDIVLPDNSRVTGGTAAHLNGGSGDDAYFVRAGQAAVPASAVRLTGNNVYINDRSERSSSKEGNSLTVGFSGSGSVNSFTPMLSFGSLKLTFSELDLSIHLQNFDKDNVLEGPRDIDTFVFGDGPAISYEQLVGFGFDLSGTDADDVIEGSSVADRIVGLEGDDALTGGRGDDHLVGGVGNDQLNGGEGDDVYRFEIGDGVDEIRDMGGSDRILFGEGLDSADLIVGKSGDDLLLSFSELDQLVLKDWFGSNKRFVESFEFADGSVVAALDIEQSVVNPGVVVEGTYRSDRLVGSEGDDELRGYAGNDKISGLAGNDVIVGGPGNDVLRGGAGDDIFRVGPGDNLDIFWGGAGHDRIVGSEGDDRIGFKRRFGVQHSIEEIDGGGGYNTLTGSRFRDTLDFSGTLLRNIHELRGEGGNDRITGTAGNDVIVGGDGNDTLAGGLGSDTYMFSRSHDSDVIVDEGGVNDVLVLSDVAHDDVWLMRSGDDLLLSVIGTNDQVSISDWYSEADAKVETITSADGMVLLDSAVERLVTAMAAFNPTQSDVSEGSIPMEESLQNQIALAWHTA
jgi:Ca2+-binding RTX toxin-like protein